MYLESEFNNNNHERELEEIRCVIPSDNTIFYLIMRLIPHSAFTAFTAFTIINHIPREYRFYGREKYYFMT